METRTPLFQKRHYEAIAEIMQKTEGGWDHMLQDLCDAFKKDNPLFNRDRFLKAATR